MTSNNNSSTATIELNEAFAGFEQDGEIRLWRITRL